ncbi:carbohydrate kinase family protein [Kitasatospora sp. NPDC054939]
MSAVVHRPAGGPARILVVGECVADILPGADGTERAHPGGSPANVAYGLARLGLPTTLLTQLGGDPYGRLVRAHLERPGVVVNAEPVQRTPSARVRLDEHGRARYAFDIAWTLTGGAAAGALRAAGRPDHLHLGSIGAVTEPGAAAVLALAERLRGSALISYDPNVRPALMGERAEAVRRVERCVALSDLVKASDEDCAWLHTGQAPEAVAERWLDLGARAVVVTRGADGAFAVTPEGRTAVPAVPADVADTVGAGDAFMAALLRALHADGPVRACPTDPQQLGQALAEAATAAALTVARAGANPPDAAELRAALAAAAPAGPGHPAARV